MDIVLLDYYLRLFAIVANLFPYLLLENIKDYLKSSVLKELNQEIRQESLKLFGEYFLQYSSISSKDNVQLLWKTVRQIDDVIPKKQKFQILLRFLLFEKLLLRYSSPTQEISFSEITDFIAKELKIQESEYNNCKGFISEKYYQINDLQRLLIISDSRSFQLDLPYLQRKNLKGRLIFLYIEGYNIILFNYKGKQSITYNKQPVYTSSIYFFNKGTSINGDGFEPIHFNQVLRKFKVHEHINLKMEVRDLEFKYKNSNHGIHKLNLKLEEEQLIGIIGRSGSGKSTLINLLIGNKQPNKGSITINGIDLKFDNEKLDGIIGYVSQDDLLLEELSVFMNLLLNAKLCFGDMTNEFLEEKVNNLLLELDLYDVRDMQVGSPLNRLISGGQRKKLNMALELIREPLILFVDEPTSGLSSSDSEEIMQLLSEQTYKGKIVVVNIHQPSSDIFKMFDKIIVLDKEGYPVYFGSPLEAIPYFNDYYQKVYVNADMCNLCENVNPEAIFKVLEEKKTNDFGEFIKERKTLPNEWHQLYLSSNQNDYQTEPTSELPKIHFNKPGLFKQFLIFSKRNLLVKITNYQYILLALLISPVLALILSLLCRYNGTNNNSGQYIFAYNDNIPSYFFMSVIVALFLGLIMSAEEIIKDRKIIMRESFIKLSKFSFINSKVAFVFMISAIQLLLYVIIGNYILGIQGMVFSFWLILFSTACFANLLGLVISSILNSEIAVYIMVPLIIVPQMLLSGVVVEYDKINKYLSSNGFVPIVGNIMASSWAFEAMVVRQFSANEFQKRYFETEKQESNVKYNLLFVIPEIKKTIQNIKSNQNKSENFEDDIKFLSNELEGLNNQFGFGNISIEYSDLKHTINRIDNLNTFLSGKLNRISAGKDSITRSLVREFADVDGFLNFKNTYYNNGLANIVLKRKDIEPYSKVENRIIRKFEPIYQTPNSTIGRAHFLSASKRLGKNVIDTYKFNLFVIWFMCLITYLILISIFFKKPNKPNLKLSILK